MRSDQVRGAVFFQPGNDSQQPPPVSDQIWSLHDGGQWKSANGYPVYAIPGMLGAFLLDELAQYSGNMSEVPYGDQLVQIYDSHDTIRLYARMDLDTTSGIPSLWVFLIIVLAILLAVVLLTSLVMHYIQRRQRNQLQRRVANGEVDLEALGIKRLQVPQELLDEMPTYTYTTKDEPDGVTEVGREKAVGAEVEDAVKTTGGDTVKTAVHKVNQTEGDDIVGAAAPVLVTREVPFSQPTCPICLDDFVHRETTVRELPCNHIFHPECIDSFLRDTSSLCPMCKKSSLPAGYCPVKVTNLMVRRERLMRRVRERGGTSSEAALPGPILAMGRTVRSTISIPMSSHPPPGGSAGGSHHFSAEMNAMGARRQTTAEEEMPADVQHNTSTRRAWRVQRLARQQARNYDERAEQARAVDESRPLCEYCKRLWDMSASLTLARPGRRVAGRFFPNLD